MKDPLVTTCVICYNQADFLSNLIKTTINQTYSNIEFIISDDCSTDESKEIINFYENDIKNRFEKYKIILRKNNVGPCENFKSIVNYSNGSFFQWIDGDDYYFPEKTKDCLEFLESNQSFSMVHSDFCDFNGHFVWKRRKKTIPSGQIFNQLIAGNFIMSCTTMFKTKVFLENARFDLFKKRNYIMFDYPCFLSIAKNNLIGYLDKSLSFYRVLPNSMSHNKKTRKEFIIATKKIQNDAKNGML